MLVLLTVTATPAEATHFRYRALSWEQMSGNEVRFHLRIADRRSFYGAPSVGDAWQEHVHDLGDGTQADFEGSVAAVNEIDDWFVADVYATHTYSGPGPWEVNWVDCCTLSSLRNSPDSSLRSRAVVDLSGTRASPRISIAPIVNVPAGQGLSTVKVPALDPDSSSLTYRMATQEESMTTQPPAVAIDPRTGVLTWQTDGLAEGLWITTVVVADAGGAETQATFLLNLGDNQAGNPPSWTSPTPPDRTIFKPRLSQTFTMRASDPDGDPVLISNVGLPDGVTCIDVANPAVEAEVTCTVAPRKSQFELLSFNAQDPSGNSAGFKNYTVGAGRYVALGDSFQSGEGAPSPDYESGTDVDNVNECHRSPVAYPRLLAATPGAPSRTTFVACSGAKIADLTHEGVRTNGPPWNEGSQLKSLDQDVTLITMGIGGNDVDFAKVIKACVKTPCLKDHDASTRRKIADLDTAGTDGRTPLEGLYRDALGRAPNAKLYVLGYPRFFEKDGNWIGCKLVFPGDQRWINSMIALVNDIIEKNARRAGAVFVDVEEAFNKHTLCEDDASMNGIVPTQLEHSFHPNQAGHRRLLAVLAQTLGSKLADRTFLIAPGSRTTTTTTVAAGATSATFASRWPGSDIVMTLTSPSGRVVDRDSVEQDVDHVVGPTTENYTLTDPEPGVWTVELFGADVGADGEELELSFATEMPVNQPPSGSVAQVTQGATVSVKAETVSDPEGTEVTYLWDFGDGTTATTAEATHTYAVAGTYVPTLVMTDAGGAEGFAQGVPVTVEGPPAGSETPPPAQDGQPPATTPPTPPQPAPPVTPTEPPAAGPAPAGPTARTIDLACPSGRVPANAFTDVITGSTHERAISCLVWWKVANGRTPTSYAPSAGVTREAMASFVARTILEAQPGALSDTPPDAFGDDNSSIHQKAINQLAAAGIVSGTGGGNYSPSAGVTRGQMAKFLANAAKHVQGSPLPVDRDLFSDDSTSLFQDDINRVAQAGLTGGRADGTYGPTGPVLRDQMGSFLARTLDLFVASGARLPA